MLVLTRKNMESIQIGNDVTITVTHIGNGKVKLGIQAPTTVRVTRSELSAEPMAQSKGHVSKTENVMEHKEDQASIAFHEAPLDFDTDYAAELEDQLLLLAD